MLKKIGDDTMSECSLSMYVSNSDDFLVSGSSDSTSRVWSLKSMECLHVLEGHTDAVNCVAIKVTFSAVCV